MRFWMPFLAFVALLIVFSISLRQDPTELPSTRLSQPFPAFTLPSLADEQRLLTQQDLIGQVSLVNIWATWCVSCRVEHGALMALAQEHQVPIIGINYKDGRNEALQWLKELGNPYVFNIYDPAGRLPIDLGVYGTPETFIIDKKGIIVHRHVGPINPEDWRSGLLLIIEQARSRGK